MSEIRTDTINNASGDNDSGIDLSTNDKVVIKTANTTAWTVDASQNVGIGTSSPTSSSGGKLLAIETTADVHTNLVFNTANTDKNGIIEARRTGRSGAERFAQLNLQNNSDGGEMRFYTASSGSDISERMRIDSSGNVGFGITSPTFASGNGFHLADNFYHGYGNGNGTRPDFQVGQDSGTNTLAFRCGTGGDTIDLSINTSGVFSGDFNDTSDERLKENIQNIADNQINIVKQLRPVTFDWKEQGKGSDTGFIAQEVKLLLPNDVHTATGQDDDSQLGINSLGLIATLTKALQESIAKIETLEARITALENA